MSDTAPGLEMLWEADAPGDALETRFGFGAGSAAGRWVATTLDEQWGVRVEACERIVISGHNALAWVRTSSGPMLAKWSVAPPRFPRLAALARLTTWVGQQGVPVSAPVEALDGRGQVEIDGVSLGLQRRIEGNLLDTGDVDQVRAAGAVLGRLHETLAAYPDVDQVPDLVAPSAPLAVTVTGWLDSCPAHVPQVARDALRRMVADASTEPLSTQLVHGDFRSANILCLGSEIAAVIDFEEARLDHAIVELARSAVMLGTRFRDWGPVSAEVRATFLGGYRSVRRLSGAEASWWDALVLWYSLLLVPAGDDPTGWGRAAVGQLRRSGEDA